MKKDLFKQLPVTVYTGEKMLQQSKMKRQQLLSVNTNFIYNNRSTEQAAAVPACS